MITGIFLGVIIGVAGMILVALYLAARDKPATKQTEIHCTTLGDASMEAANEYFVKASIKQASDGKLYEVKMTRH
jgi:hypothetical protein